MSRVAAVMPSSSYYAFVGVFFALSAIVLMGSSTMLALHYFGTYAGDPLFLGSIMAVSMLLSSVLGFILIDSRGLPRSK